MTNLAEASAGQSAWARNIAVPLRTFLHTETSSGVVLLVAALPTEDERGTKTRPPARSATRAGIATTAPSLNHVEEVNVMGTLLMLSFLVLIGPLSYFFGVDSRDTNDRGWVAAPR